MTSNSESSGGFRIGPECKVFSDDGREIQPGSGEIGLIARSGPLPLGYHNDPQKTAYTFRTIDGVRYAIPGDYCVVEADGSLTLLGRGSQCINSGGEKIFVEEVEEAIKAVPGVADALVIGLPDPAFGQVVAAAVSVTDERAANAAGLKQALLGRLAGYKIPRVIVFRRDLPRLPSGKADYRTLRSQFD
jgi:fatty-acyl-CoA synthase